MKALHSGLGGRTRPSFLQVFVSAPGQSMKRQKAFRFTNSREEAGSTRSGVSVVDALRAGKRAILPSRKRLHATESALAGDLCLRPGVSFSIMGAGW